MTACFLHLSELRVSSGKYISLPLSKLIPSYYKLYIVKGYIWFMVIPTVDSIYSMGHKYNDIV